MTNDYYVYVYLDPRNYEEFYFGKGIGSRKFAHLSEDSDSDKRKRIAAIQAEGQEPIIRVIARNLSEHDALLVEKTLLWKLGRGLTNISSGHYASNFRPPSTMHRDLAGFDFQKGLYYFNVGEGPTRCWEDYRTHGFIAAGQGARWRDSICGFQPGDVVAAYLKGRGFVGIGEITQPAKPVREVTINGRPLLKLDLRQPGLDVNADSDELCEYVALVRWHRHLDSSSAKWEARSGLYSTTHVRASLERQTATISYLEREFGIDLRALIQ